VLRGIRSRLRQAFSRDGLVNGVKTLAWVVPMTVVIWVYAEREQIAHQTVLFRVEAKNSNPDKQVVELISRGPEGRNFTVRADLSGPQAGLLEVKRILESRAFTLDTASFSPGYYRDQDLQHMIDIDPMFARLGVTVSNVSPAKIDVSVDPIVPKEVRVKARGMTNVEDKREFTPANVVVTGQKSVLDAAEAQGNLVAYAELGDVHGQASVDVPVTVPFPHINVKPAMVTAKTTEVVGYVSVVPVWVLEPTDRAAGQPWDRGKAEPAASVLHFVPVTGPAGSFEPGTDPTKPFIYPPEKGGVRAILDVSTATDPVTNTTPFKSVHSAVIRYDFGKTGLKLKEPTPKEPLDPSFEKMDFTYVKRGEPE
jgi:hypothetical protein